MSILILKETYEKDYQKSILLFIFFKYCLILNIYHWYFFRGVGVFG